MEELKQYSVSLTKKIKFFEFALGRLKNNDNYYSNYGFCRLFDSFFKLENYIDFVEFLPELQKFKPEYEYYTYNNEKTRDTDQFWFPVGNGNKERIEICEQILEDLKSK